MFKKEKFKIIILSLIVLACAFVWYAVYREDRHGVLTVSFLDVGQGDAIFIDAPNGNQVLIDAGPDKKVLRSLSEVMPFYDHEIDLIALSHPHTDHIAGFLDILPRYLVSGFIESGVSAKTPEYISLKKLTGENNIKEIEALRGMKIDLGGGATMDVLLPGQNSSKDNPHEGMMVLRLVYGDTSFLLTGDLENATEDMLVYLEGENIKSDVLKVGHHGSKNATHPMLLGNVKPEYAVISVGVKNMYGHPATETLERIEKFEIPVLRTDEEGTITIKSDGEKIIVLP
ncbi:MAG TPA: MBL fold metallo-hydrolase [Candidatus Paceibacterota bacterium]|nr:MBL fold metallo-hydrolase [Candidatus Paceibacterota bacterium]